MKSSVVRVAFLALLVLLTLYLPGCGEKDPFPVFPSPQINSLSPPNIRMGSGDLLLTVTGSGFNETSAVNFMGSDLSSTLVSDTQLTAMVPRSLVGSIGSAQVFVKNHPIAGGDSNVLFFFILNFNLSSPLNVSSTPAVPSITPSIGIDGTGGIHLLWDENFTILYSKSTDGGATFSAGQALFPPSGTSVTPVVFVEDSGVIHAVWDDLFDIYYSRSEDGGISFFPRINLSQTPTLPPVGPTTGFSATPAIAVDDNGKIHVVWDEDYNILYSSSTDGVLFSPGQSIFTPSGFSITPAIAVDRIGKLQVVWNDGSFIFSSFSNDGGASFSTGQLISDPSFFGENPRVVMDEFNGVHAVWEEEGAILYGSSLDGGSTFLSGIIISDLSFYSVTPVISIDGIGNIHALWDENRVILHSLSSDRGVVFSRGRIISNSGASETPTLVADKSGSFFSAWKEGPPSTSEIFFSRGD